MYSPTAPFQGYNSNYAIHPRIPHKTQKRKSEVSRAGRGSTHKHGGKARSCAHVLRTSFNLSLRSNPILCSPNHGSGHGQKVEAPGQPTSSNGEEVQSLHGELREEYLQRLEIFAGNMLRAAENQALDPTAIHGVTQFSDLTEDEFQRHYTGVNGGFPWNNGAGDVAPPLEVDGLPEDFDWGEKGAVTEVKMQV